MYALEALIVSNLLITFAALDEGFDGASLGWKLEHIIDTAAIDWICETLKIWVL